MNTYSQYKNLLFISKDSIETILIDSFNSLCNLDNNELIFLKFYYIIMIVYKKIIRDP
jgi:hypothetical protein